jgi:hypothetical protein
VNPDPSNPVFAWRDTMRLNLKSRDLDALCASELAELRDLLDHWWHIADAKLRTMKAESSEEESE